MSDLRDIIARNLRALVEFHGDRGGLYTSARAIGKKAEVGKSTVARIMHPRPNESLPAVDTLDAVARVFKVRAWQLLIEGFDPSWPPQCMSADIERELTELRALRTLLDSWTVDNADSRSTALGTGPHHKDISADHGVRKARARRPKAPRS